jgi:hypothetical protein
VNKPKPFPIQVRQAVLVQGLTYVAADQPQPPHDPCAGCAFSPQSLDDTAEATEVCRQVKGVTEDHCKYQAQIWIPAEFMIPITTIHEGMAFVDMLERTRSIWNPDDNLIDVHDGNGTPLFLSPVTELAERRMDELIKALAPLAAEGQTARDYAIEVLMERAT